MKNNVKKVFLENLPKTYKGYDWINSINYKVKFIYYNIEGVFDIIAYDKKQRKLTIKYNEYEFKMATSIFVNCGFKNIFEEQAPKFRIEIGTRFQDSKRDITIIDRKIAKIKDGRTILYKKYYKYKCNKCSFDCGKHYNIRNKEHKDELWVEESRLLTGKKIGCACCCNPSHIVVEGINDIYTTDKWLIPIINDNDFCKTHTNSCQDKIYPICPICGIKKVKMMKINSIHYKKSISCPICSDGYSYPEKFLFSVLEQLGVNFEYHKTFNWSKNKEYDFYFEWGNNSYIVETHGKQHYKDINRSHAKTLKEEQENDKIKKELALKNGTKEENYIVIDCRKSDLEWIRDNDDGILNSKLVKLFDLSKVDWNKVELFLLNSRVKEACEYKKEDSKLTTTQIGKLMNLSPNTILKYLKIGNKLNWCSYNSEFEQTKAHKCNNKPLIYFKDEQLFLSAKELSLKSLKLYGLKLNSQNITYDCRIKNSYAKYIEDLTPEEYIKYDIENKLKNIKEEW